MRRHPVRPWPSTRIGNPGAKGRSVREPWVGLRMNRWKWIRVSGSIIRMQYDGISVGMLSGNGEG